MKDADQGRARRPGDGEGGSGAANPPAGAVADVAHRQMSRQARALRLSRELGLRASVDATGWLCSEVEIVYRRARDGTIAPFAVRVGSGAIDTDLAGPQGVQARCRQYNAAVRRLRQLADRLASLVARDPTELCSGSALVRAQRELSQLNALIAWRQETHMAAGVVRLKQLGAEIECLECCEDHLSRLVGEAEAARLPGEVAGQTEAARSPSSPRPARWRRWMPWRTGAA